MPVRPRPRRRHRVVAGRRAVLLSEVCAILGWDPAIVGLRERERLHRFEEMLPPIFNGRGVPFGNAAAIACPRLQAQAAEDRTPLATHSLIGAIGTCALRHPVHSPKSEILFASLLWYAAGDMGRSDHSGDGAAFVAY